MLQRPDSFVRYLMSNECAPGRSYGIWCQTANGAMALRKIYLCIKQSEKSLRTGKTKPVELLCMSLKVGLWVWPFVRFYLLYSHRKSH